MMKRLIAVVVVTAAFSAFAGFKLDDLKKKIPPDVQKKLGVKPDAPAAPAAPAPAPAPAPAAQAAAPAAAPAPAPAPARVNAVVADPPSPGGVCDSAKSTGLCYVFSGAKTGEAKIQNGNKTACKFLKGQFNAGGGCPKGTNQVGQCTVLQGSPEEYIVYYYQTKNFDAAKAAADCANPKSSIHRQGAGSWIAAK